MTFKISKSSYPSIALAGASLVMAGIVLITVNSGIANRNISPVNPESNVGATNLSCLLTLTRATPPPVITCNQKLDIAIVIDRSSTMNETESDGRTKLAWAKEAATGFVNTIKAAPWASNVRISLDSFGAQGNDNTGALSPNTAGTFNSTLDSVLTSNLGTVLTALSNLKFINEGTCIQCGIRIGNGQLTTTANRRIEILLSDGMANHNWDGKSTTDPRVNAISEANTGRSKGIGYYVVGYGLPPNDIDEATLINMAGSVDTYQYKPNVADWSNALINILKSACGTTTPTSTPVAQNLLINPSFDVAGLANWYTPWGMQVQGGAAATLTKDTSTFHDGTGSAKVNVTTPTATDWYVQFNQSPIAVTTGHNYTLSFWAKSSVAKTVPAVVQKLDSPYTEYMHTDVALTTSWKQYTLTFTPTVNDSRVKVSFSLGAVAGSTWFDSFYFGL